MKRFRRRKAKPGQLLVYYGKLPHDRPDVLLAWGGEGATKNDAHLVYGVLCMHRIEMEIGDRHTFQHVRVHSLIEELERRGYDITTLRFSIERKEG